MFIPGHETVSSMATPHRWDVSSSQVNYPQPISSPEPVGLRSVMTFYPLSETENPGSSLIVRMQLGSILKVQKSILKHFLHLFMLPWNPWQWLIHQLNYQKFEVCVVNSLTIIYSLQCIKVY